MSTNVSNAKNWVKGEKYYGRANFGVVTLNLVDVALSSAKDMDAFWGILESRAELCHKAHNIRYNMLKDVKSDVAPLFWQHGAIARLEKGESIGKLLKGGYFTASLGYAGLYECVKFMTGKSHTDGGEGYDFAISVMKRLKSICDRWKLEDDIDYSPYGTPETKM